MSDRNSEVPSPFGRYRIESRIGRGAFGSVFWAHDVRLDRPIALKILSHRPNDEDALRRFAREAELSRRLVHPHTVRVYDFGVQNDRSYIAFELLDGESLDKRIRRLGALSAHATRRIAICVLKSLMEAHGHGIVHRDIKPGNVFLCRYAGETDFVKVLDFGIAKAEGYDLTAHGWLVGTPAYMAPEQIANDKLGPSADLYSLGLVMATMLAGTPVVSGSTAEILTLQLSDEPIELPPEVVRTPLHTVIRRATEKKRARRYATAAEMLADLEAVAMVAPTLHSEVPVTDRECRRATCTPVHRESQPPGSARGPNQFNHPSVAPVVYGAEPSVAQRLLSRPRPSLLIAALVASILFVALASSALVLALRPSPGSMTTSIDRVDPSFEPALVRSSLARGGLRLTEERNVTPAIVDFGFTHPELVGVVRVETPSSLADAIWLEREGRSDERRLVVRRGRHVLSIWAAPRGRVSFERASAERVFGLLFGS